tara:strand:+ start:959 stop:1081 length:123 start_codon:yes stop_codon:yes gene_type:complete
MFADWVEGVWDMAGWKGQVREDSGGGERRRDMGAGWLMER